MEVRASCEALSTASISECTLVSVTGGRDGLFRIKPRNEDSSEADCVDDGSKTDDAADGEGEKALVDLESDDDLRRNESSLP